MNKNDNNNEKNRTIKDILTNNIIKIKSNFLFFRRIAAIGVIGAVLFGIWIFFAIKK